MATIYSNKFTKYIVRISSVSFEATEKTVAIADKPVSISIIVKRKNNFLIGSYSKIEKPCGETGR